MLWLALFSLLQTLLAANAAPADALLSMATSFAAAATPCLATAAAAAAAPAQSLPLCLAGAADSFSAAMFAAAEERLQHAQLTQVLMHDFITAIHPRFSGPCNSSAQMTSCREALTTGVLRSACWLSLRSCLQQRARMAWPACVRLCWKRWGLLS